MGKPAVNGAAILYCVSRPWHTLRNSYIQRTLCVLAAPVDTRKRVGGGCPGLTGLMNMLIGQSPCPWTAHVEAQQELRTLGAHADDRQDQDLADLIHDIACAAERVQADGACEMQSLASILETTGACNGLHVFAAGTVIACCWIRDLGAQARPRFSFQLLALGQAQNPNDESVVCQRAQGRKT